MCLVIKKEPKIAKENILVWKYVTKEDVSAIKKFQYKKGQRYKTEFIFDSVRCNPINYAFMSERDAERARKNCKWLKAVHQGFHSYLSPKYMSVSCSSYTYKIIPCIIPKGATYYESYYGTGCTVSNELIYDQTIEEYELSKNSR